MTEKIAQAEQDLNLEHTKNKKTHKLNQELSYRLQKLETECVNVEEMETKLASIKKVLNDM